MTDETVGQERKRLGLSALLITVLLALIPAACGPERDPVQLEVQARPAAVQSAG